MTMLLALGYFTALATAFLWKLFPLWNSAIPGGLQDTRLFLWNAWWFHHALSVLHMNPYHTPMLFHPFGASLISHDFPLWTNLITHLGQAQGLSMIAASNVWFGVTWVLIGFCTYGLAREVTGEPVAGLLAGTIAMTHSYTLARAMQNWGQFNIYGIALFLWCLVRARKRSSSMFFVLAGVALAWTAACHYYFLIYSVLIWLVVAARDLSPYSLSIAKKSSPPNASVGGPWIPRLSLRGMTLGLAAIFGLVGVGISIHPMIVNLGGATLSMRTPQNVLFVMWILLMVWAASHFRIETGHRTLDRSYLRQRMIHHLLLVGTATLLLTPLFWETFNLVRAGGYPKQGILWKTHNSGANLLALFMPNPIQALWGQAISSWYTVRGMNAQEQAASIGWVCLALVFLSKIWKEKGPVRLWLGVALFATVLAMGTHLHIAQYNLWCPLPFFGFRLLPVLGNVRIPERWMALGTVAWSVVAAIALVRLATDRGWSLRKAGILAIALVLFENWPGVPYQPTPAVSPVYERLRQLPAGAVLTLPLYIGDSSIGTGDALNGQFIFPWDHLWAQINHEKPIVGGYIGRISRKIIDSYKADPFIHTLLDLEEHKIQNHDPEPAFGEYAYRNLGFQYVLVYAESTDTEALKYVLRSLPLELVEKDDSIQLYRIN